MSRWARHWSAPDSIDAVKFFLSGLLACVLPEVSGPAAAAAVLASRVCNTGGRSGCRSDDAAKDGYPWWLFSRLDAEQFKWPFNTHTT